MGNRKVIREFQGEYRFLSNFYMSEQELFGMTFCCNEQWYVYSKCANVEDQIKVMKLTDPGEIKRFGKKVKVRADFDKIKYGIMKLGIASKFYCNDALMAKLINTGNAILQEGNRWGDKYWGINLNPTKGKIGAGENNLGKLLMELRSEGIDALVETSRKEYDTSFIPKRSDVV